jgi:hypothetical protein
LLFRLAEPATVPDLLELELLDRKLNQLKLAYDQYFLGSRPREPVLLRDEVRKAVVLYSNEGIQNTALRFKFGSICSRYQAFRRRWTDTLRKIEEGSYERHQFKANLRRDNSPSEPAQRPPQDRSEIYAAYLEARRACGQDVTNLTPAKLDAVLDKQEAALRKRFSDSRVRFRILVEDGQAKIKASRDA